jgi:hypothetical protein
VLASIGLAMMLLSVSAMMAREAALASAYGLAWITFVQELPMLAARRCPARPVQRQPIRRLDSGCARL